MQHLEFSFLQGIPSAERVEESPQNSITVGVESEDYFVTNPSLFPSAKPAIMMHTATQQSIVKCNGTGGQFFATPENGMFTPNK